MSNTRTCKYSFTYIYWAVTIFTLYQTRTNKMAENLIQQKIIIFAKLVQILMVSKDIG